MKYISSKYTLLENLAQSRAIIRKLGIDSDDPRYIKIVDTTARDGYTGIITKLVFVYKIDLDEALDLYKSLKEKKIDVGKLSNATYNDILDLVYDEQVGKDENEFIFKYKNYRVFRVKTYESGLDINSPSWCLKTRSNYDDYTKSRGGRNFVMIDDKYFKRGILTLPTPNTYHGDSYTNRTHPNIRIGITIWPNSVGYFNDNNMHPSDISDMVLDITPKLRKWILENEKKNKIGIDGEFKIGSEFIADAINNVNDMSFDYNLRALDIATKDIINISKLDIHDIGMSVKDFCVKYAQQILSEFSLKNGAWDIFLYTVYGKDVHPLSGMYLFERELYDKFMRYTYGVTKSYWGVKYIKQSYNDVNEYLKELANRFDILIRGDRSYGELLDIEIEGDINVKPYYSVSEITTEDVIQGYRVKFLLHKFVEDNLKSISVWPDAHLDLEKTKSTISESIKRFIHGDVQEKDGILYVYFR